MKAKNIKTTKNALDFCEGLINDFETGITDKKETLKLLKEYTFAIHDLFFDQAKERVNENPNFFNETSKRNNNKLEI